MATQEIPSKESLLKQTEESGENILSSIKSFSAFDLSCAIFLIGLLFFIIISDDITALGIIVFLVIIGLLIFGIVSIWKRGILNSYCSLIGLILSLKNFSIKKMWGNLKSKTNHHN